jgi:hypothetical protein
MNQPILPNVGSRMHWDKYFSQRTFGSFTNTWYGAW